MRRRFRIEVRVQTEVVRIDRAEKMVEARSLGTGAEQIESYDVLILSPGAEPVRPPIPGIESRHIFTLRSLSDMDAIKGHLDGEKPQRVVILGGGYIGLEMAEALRKREMEVVLIELANQVMAPADPEMVTSLHQQLRAKGVDLRLGTSVVGFREDGNSLRVQLGTGESISCGMAIVSVGVRPETKLAQEAGLSIGSTGGILVDDHLRTSDPHIFAVGDAIEVTDLVGGFATFIPLAGPANRQGRIAADNALGGNSVYRKTQGTAICKVFDLAFGMTGMSEKALRKAAMPHEKVYVHPASHASYYPGAHPISLKLLFHPENGKILGAQAVGTDGVDKRIDVLAVAIRAGLSVFDLGEMELCYAPPYGSAKDPINYAGFVASNVLRGQVGICQVEDILHLRDGQGLLDVRTAAEIEAGGIPGALNIPLDELRGRLNELPRDKELLVACQVGLRGYLACRILSQNGFRCRNLTGGYKTYRDFMGIHGFFSLNP
jgi:NADPH-dependent 2,4-dienoyl-CoA reductase/sulfur reductase-like enzyme/rhodanese-related sulfurtransferase